MKEIKKVSDFEAGKIYANKNSKEVFMFASIKEVKKKKKKKIVELNMLIGGKYHSFEMPLDTSVENTIEVEQ